VRARGVETVEAERPVVMNPGPVMPVGGRRILASPFPRIEPVRHELPQMMSAAVTPQ
jgi:hypothetical protein